VIAAWVAYVIKNEKVQDSQNEEISRALQGDESAVAQRLVSVIDLQLANNSAFMAVVVDQLQALKI
jgi:hypothetical protein